MVEDKRIKVAKDKWHLMWQNGKFDFKCHRGIAGDKGMDIFFRSPAKKFIVTVTAGISSGLLAGVYFLGFLFVCFVFAFFSSPFCSLFQRRLRECLCNWKNCR